MANGFLTLAFIAVMVGIITLLNWLGWRKERRSR